MTDLAAPAQLGRTERLLIDWLAREPETGGAVGECKGMTLDALLLRGLVEIKPVGHVHADYDRAVLTQAGWDARQAGVSERVRMTQEMADQLLRETADGEECVTALEAVIDRVLRVYCPKPRQAGILLDEMTARIVAGMGGA